MLSFKGNPRLENEKDTSSSKKNSSNQTPYDKKDQDSMDMESL
jgi:hypothetical protein